MRRVLIIVAILLVPLVPIVLVVSGVLKTKPRTIPPVAITIWGTDDPATAFTTLIAKYQQTRPYAKITYQQVRPEDYVNQLLSAWAQGTGPDLFFVPQTWVGQMAQYATPMPAQLGVSLVQSGGGIFRSSTKIVQQQQPAPTTDALRRTFVDVVINDLVIDGQVWGLPLAMDTLVLYYNKDLLNNAKVFEPAKIWGDLLSQIESNRLTITDEREALIQSGVALGTVDNLPHAIDLLTLLMLQNGMPEVSTKNMVRFGEQAKTALDFFLSFANPKKVAYSWNVSQPNAREAFLAGKVAYYFGTLADRPSIAGGNLNWGLGQMLHLSLDGDRDGATGQTRFIDRAQYQTLMVSKASALGQKSTLAWNILYFFSRGENVPLYLQATGRLAAIKSILVGQKDNPELGPFAGQLLTAKTWYHGRGGAAAEDYLRAMVKSILSGQATVDEALLLAAQQIESTI